ncbi:dihydrofolate reductase family protein [uncultured Meiothermus sp.]|jgi:dihydrofolate reductase|uniref:dihydrofolate reductase family protein n=1 Tax=uncultured Meiothermus sp. TaxID=157471 RepID=UPI0026070CD5|nr:dihydrofolate reductase family protein [uncultured Meiothermus sp.]
MRKLILQEFVSIDGLVAGPNDSVDFIPASMQGDLSFGQEQVALMDTIDTLLLGRTTYEMFAGYWPNVTQGAEKEFADKFNAVLKVVFSKALKRAPWGKWNDGRIVRGSAVEEVARLKQQSGKNLLISGSISLAQSLIDESLVDEYRLVMCPVVLGSGRSLFRDNLASIQLKLVNANVLDRGAVSLIYSQQDAAG